MEPNPYDENYKVWHKIIPIPDTEPLVQQLRDGRTRKSM